MSSRLELRDRLKASGYQYLTDAQLDEYLDEGAREVQGEELWPWRSQITEVALGTPAYLGVVDFVQYMPTTRQLWPRRQSEITEQYGDPTLAGDPRFYLIDERVDGTCVLSSYPVATGVVYVRSFDRAGWMNPTVAQLPDDDEPAMPVRWHKVVYLAARMKAKAENGGEAEVASLIQLYERDLDKMRDQELHQQWDEPDVIRCTERY